MNEQNSQFIFREFISSNLTRTLEKKEKNNSLKHPDSDPIQFSERLGKMFEEVVPESFSKIREAAEKESLVIQVKQLAAESTALKSPYDGVVCFKQTKRTIANIYKVIYAMGMNSVFYPDEENTTLRAISPRKNTEGADEKSSQSPFFELDWHSDMAYRPAISHDTALSPMPDYLVFGVAKVGDPYLPIRFIPLQAVIDQLDQGDIESGLSPEFEITSPDSVSKLVVISKTPALVKDGKGGYYSRINLNKIRCLTPRAQHFLDNFKGIIEDGSVAQSIHFEKGDVIALNNKRTLHTRAAFTPNWKGDDRFLVRIYAVRNLAFGIPENSSKAWKWK